MFATVLVGACSRQDSSAGQTNDTSFQYLAFERAYRLEHSATDYDTDSDLTIGCRASLFVPAMYMGRSVNALRDSVLAVAFDTVSSSAIDAAEAYFRSVGNEIGYTLMPAEVDEESADSTSTVLGSLDNYDGMVDVLGRMAAVTPRYISYAITSSSYYPRAAHGMYSTYYVVYSADDDAVLSLDDIVTAEGKQALPDMIRRRARALRGLIGVTDIAALPSRDNFYINADGNIVFVYQPYEVASYAQGEIAIMIESYTLDDYLTPAGRRLLLND